MSAITPQVYPRVLKNQQAVIPLEPLAGDTGQGTTPTTSVWVPAPQGSILEAQLVITALEPSPGGAICVHVETCNQVQNGVSVDGPRFMGSFRMTPDASLPSSQPFIGNPVCDNYIRVVATPSPNNTNCVWSVTGTLICAAYASST
jgi:hypothetical protein